MPPLMRSAGTAVLGALAAIVLTAVTEAINGRLYPAPAGLDVDNREASSAMPWAAWEAGTWRLD